MDDSDRHDLVMILNDDHLTVAFWTSGLDQLGVVTRPDQGMPAVGETRQDLTENQLFLVIIVTQRSRGTRRSSSLCRGHDGQLWTDRSCPGEWIQ